MATGPGGREAILKAGIDATKAKTGSEEFARAMNNMVQSAQQAWLALGRLDARLDNITRHTPGIRAMASAIRDLARATEQHAAAAARRFDARR